MKLIRKAVIPAGGFGTRMLPATKAIPKEMLSLVDKPLIEYCVEEAVQAGCEEILIITSRGKHSIEDHFDSAPDLERSLESRRKLALLECVQRLNRLARITFVRQHQALGLGHAVLLSRDFVGSDPFALLLPDDVFQCATPCMKQLTDAYPGIQASILGSVVVDGIDIEKYGCLSFSGSPQGQPFQVDDVVEKPSYEDAPSNLGVVGRYVLSPNIFPHLANLSIGAGGELQLTDGIRNLLRVEPVYSLQVEGIRHDVGDKLGFVKATIAYALKRPDLGPQLQEWLQEQLNTGITRHPYSSQPV